MLNFLTLLIYEKFPIDIVEKWDIIKHFRYSESTQLIKYLMTIFVDYEYVYWLDELTLLLLIVITHPVLADIHKTLNLKPTQSRFLKRMHWDEGQLDASIHTLYTTDIHSTFDICSLHTHYTQFNVCLVLVTQ